MCEMYFLDLFASQKYTNTKKKITWLDDELMFLEHKDVSFGTKMWKLGFFIKSASRFSKVFDFK